MSLKYDEYGDIDYKAMYYEQSEKIKDYEFLIKHARNTTWFIPIYCYAASCIATTHICKDTSLLTHALIALIPTTISILYVSIIKHFIEEHYIHYGKKYVPTIVYIILFILPPVICYFLL